MKLPEYDDRPAPGTPLYDNSSSGSRREDAKFTFLGIALPIGTILCFAAAGALLLALFN